MEKSSEEEEAKGRTFRDERSFRNPNLRNTHLRRRREFRGDKFYKP